MKSELAKVGSPWDGGDIEKWPGVAGIAGQTNYLAQNLDPFLPDPEDTSSNRDIINMRAGKKSRRAGKKSRRAGKKSRRAGKKSRRAGKKSRRAGKKSRRAGKKSRRAGKKSRRAGKKSRRAGKKSRRAGKGGSAHGNTLMPQSLINLGRNMRYNAESTWSSFTGAQQPVNPDPLDQPIAM